MVSLKKIFIPLIIICLIVCTGVQNSIYANDNEEVTFTINQIKVIGNTLLDQTEIDRRVGAYIGPNKSALDVEKARDALEALYHESGFPAVLVNIPEQKVEDSIVTLEVVESRIGEIRVSGNRYFGKSEILKLIPSLRSGIIISIPGVQRDLTRVNSIPDLSVSPILLPGKIPGTTDVELKVKDTLPLHGSIEHKYMYNQNTNDSKIGLHVSYDNLWQRRHSLSFRYQNTPFSEYKISSEKTEKMQVFIGTYALPEAWLKDHALSLSWIYSDSEGTVAESSTKWRKKSQDTILRFAYFMPLFSAYERLTHSLSILLDYKDIEMIMNDDNSEGDISDALMYTPMRYTSSIFAYAGTISDIYGGTTFKTSLNLGLRNLAGKRRDFELKRYKSSGNWMYVNLDITRTLNLPYGLISIIKTDGQVADQPLISNEQYSAGGIDSVRGYKDSEAVGDNAIHTSLEFLIPAFTYKIFGVTPYLFYDFARLWLKNPLPEQGRTCTIQSTGGGIKGGIKKIHLHYDLTIGHPIENSSKTNSGDTLFYLRSTFYF